MLSFFADDLDGVPDDATYPAPWGFAVPASSFALGVPAGGAWTLTCSVAGIGVPASIRGWALRLVP